MRILLAAEPTSRPDPRRATLIKLLAAPALMLVPGLGLAQPARAGLVEMVASARGSVLAVGSFNLLDNPRFAFRGSGFVVGDGLTVVTNVHVLPDPAASPGLRLAVLIPRAGGTPELRPAELLRSDVDRDLALLRIEGAPLPALRLAEAEQVSEGLDIAIMGFPLGPALGLVPVTHRGIVSAVSSVALPPANARQLDERAAARLRRGGFEVLQLDITAFPGHSGAPVLDIASGQVVGVVNMVLVRRSEGAAAAAVSSPSGISFAIPGRFVASLLRER